MTDENDITTEASTRRDTFRYGGTLLGTATLAGCVGGRESDDGGPNDDDSGTATQRDDDESSTESSSDSYTVSMAPVGEVTFDAVPERWIAYCNGFLDMGVALGVDDGLAGVGGDDRSTTTCTTNCRASSSTGLRLRNTTRSGLRRSSTR